MKYFSLFSGIGGFELGIGKSGNCIGFSEIDKYAVGIYQKRFPEHKNYGDITKINEKELPDFDLLVGGFPCQSFSIAGKRKGFEDTRGTLFFDIARILQAKQPKFLLLENVKGLLSHGAGGTFKRIISTLTELGYDLQWQVLNSKDFGVPQNRERVFIVGHLRGERRPEVFPFGEGEIVSAEKKSDISYCIDAHYGRGTGLRARTMIQVGTLRTHKDGSGQPVIRIAEATKKGYAEATEGDSINLSVLGSKTRRGRVGKRIAQTLDTGMQQHTLTQGGIRRLTPVECERLQGFPDGWTEKGFYREWDKNKRHWNCGISEISDSQRYKCLGNAVTVNVIQAILEKLTPPHNAASPLP